MFRMNIVRLLALLAIGATVSTVTGPTASAGLFYRWFCCCDYYYYYVPCDPPCEVEPAPMRQVRVIYFSSKFSAWFETDAMVPPDSAMIGLSVAVNVPKVGSVRGWVVSVYNQPRMNSPYKMETQNATTQAGGEVLMKNRVEAAQESLAESDSKDTQRSGLVRLWTNKAGTRQVYAELLQVRSNAVLVRDAAGKIYEQAFDSLSESDVAFLRSGSLPTAHFVSAKR